MEGISGNVSAFYCDYNVVKICFSYKIWSESEGI